MKPCFLCWNLNANLMTPQPNTPPPNTPNTASQETDHDPLSTTPNTTITASFRYSKYHSRLPTCPPSLTQWKERGSQQTKNVNGKWRVAAFTSRNVDNSSSLRGLSKSTRPNKSPENFPTNKSPENFPNNLPGTPTNFLRSATGLTLQRTYNCSSLRLGNLGF